jgi:hypothetical protein
MSDESEHAIEQAELAAWDIAKRLADESDDAMLRQNATFHDRIVPDDIRNTIIEECAKEAERGYFLSDMVRCADTMDDCAARIRALAVQTTPTKQD